MELILLAEWGHLLLFGAFALSFLAIINFIFNFDLKPRLSSLFSLGQLFLVSLSFLALVFCFVYNDFTLQYVAANSHSQLPWYYKLTAVWGAHEGSLLLWVLILAFWQYLLSRDNYLPKQVLLVSSLILFGLVALVLFSSNPFLRWLPDSPSEGLDLNPLLQDPAFVIHPPMLYLGYVGFVMPFIITMSTLLHPQEFDLDKYVYLMRKWSVLAFGFLTIGIALGSWWAYYELGWGGWWFWDPVENASFMPWLCGLALIHSLLIVKNRPTTIIWVMLLSIVTFGLSILGTFLVRSGIITSVHSFAADPERGLFILGLFVFMIGSAFVLLLIRTKYFNTQYTKKPQITFNTQTVCIGASVILFSLMIVVLLGTTYPILAEMLFSENVTIGLPYFNKVTLPFFALLLLFSAIGPYLPFTRKQYWLMGFSALVTLVLELGVFKLNLHEDTGVLLGLFLGLFLGIWLLFSTIFHFILSPKKQIKKIGMVMAHTGFALSAIGAVVNTHMIVEKEVVIAVNQLVQVGGYTFELAHLEDKRGQNYTAKTAIFNIKNVNHEASPIQVKTEKRYYANRQMALSETGLLPGFLQDIYISLGEPVGAHTWSCKIIIHPLVRWIWLGALFIALGSGISFFRLISNYNKKIHK